MSKKGKETALLNNEPVSVVKTLNSHKLELSDKAKEVAEKLKQATDSPEKGKIAVIDPDSGEYFIGKSIIEAVKEGRKKKNDPKAIFYSVRIGFPTVHVLKSIKLQGEIYHERLPKVQAVVIEKELHFESEISFFLKSFDFIIDTGFTGSVILDYELIEKINADFITYDEIMLAGGSEVQVEEYIGRVWINNSVYEDILITTMPNEFLIGMDFMRQICKRAIFDFEKDKVLFED
jgi:predicted aspartyl protease